MPRGKRFVRCHNRLASTDNRSIDDLSSDRSNFADDQGCGRKYRDFEIDHDSFWEQQLNYSYRSELIAEYKAFTGTGATDACQHNPSAVSPIDLPPTSELFSKEALVERHPNLLTCGQENKATPRSFDIAVERIQGRGPVAASAIKPTDRTASVTIATGIAVVSAVQAST